MGLSGGPLETKGSMNGGREEVEQEKNAEAASSVVKGA